MRASRIRQPTKIAAAMAAWNKLPASSRDAVRGAFSVMHKTAPTVDWRRSLRSLLALLEAVEAAEVAAPPQETTVLDSEVLTMLATHETAPALEDFLNQWPVSRRPFAYFRVHNMRERGLLKFGSTGGRVRVWAT